MHSNYRLPLITISHLLLVNSSRLAPRFAFYLVNGYFQILNFSRAYHWYSCFIRSTHFFFFDLCRDFESSCLCSVVQLFFINILFQAAMDFADNFTDVHRQDGVTLLNEPVATDDSIFSSVVPTSEFYAHNNDNSRSP